MSKCDVCGIEESVGVYSVPGVPISMAYCKTCLQENAHPWGILVAQAACLGGLSNAHEYFIEMIECTCKRLNRTMEEFESQVAEDIIALDQYLDQCDEGLKSK
jgi:hypothetical protein